MSGGFEDLGLLPEIVRATQEQGWLCVHCPRLRARGSPRSHIFTIANCRLPSDVQDESIPLILGGGDVMVVSNNSCFGPSHFRC